MTTASLTSRIADRIGASFRDSGYAKRADSAAETPPRRQSTGSMKSPDDAQDEESTAAGSSITTTCQDESAPNEARTVPVVVVVRCRPVQAGKEEMAIAFENLPNGKVNLKLDGGGRESVGGYGRGEAARAFRCNKYLGPEATQVEVFDQASYIVDRALSGYNCTIFCYGVTGSGKTFTMSGPPHRANELVDESAGIIQRVSQRIFEGIRDGSSRGETYMVEASFLEIYSSGQKEQLIDLLAKDDKRLEVKRDPNANEAFFCEGLITVPIKTPDEMCDYLNAGRKRCHFIETTKNCNSSRSHCLFMVTIESIIEQPGEKDPIVKRAKVMLVDLAGSESLKKVQAADEGNEELRKQQAIGINRVLTSLGTVVNNMNNGLSGGHRDSALTMLLRDCLGGNARALLFANIGPEKETQSETVKTLGFAQQMTAVKNNVSVNRIKKEQSAIVQLRQRHMEMLKILEQEPAGGKQKEEQRKLQAEVEEIGKRLINKESAEKTLEEMHKEHFLKMEEMKQEMAKTVTTEIEKFRLESMNDLTDLKHSVQALEQISKAHNAQTTKQSDEHESEIRTWKAKYDEAQTSHKAAEQDANALRVRLASVEERAQMLQTRMDEMQRERNDGEDERRALRAQSEQHYQKLAAAEGELYLNKSEVERLRGELERATSSKNEEAELARKQREESRAREEQLQRENTDLHRSMLELKKEHEIEVLKSQADHREEISKIKTQLEQSERETADAKKQLEKEQEARQHYEAQNVDLQEALQQEIDKSEVLELDVVQLTQERDESFQMLHEMQETIKQMHRE